MMTSFYYLLAMVLLTKVINGTQNCSDDQCSADTPSIPQLINLPTYPIDDPSSEFTISLVNNAHNDFITNGIAIFPDFLLPGVANALAQDVMSQKHVMWVSEAIHTIYQDDHDDPAYDDQHIRNKKMHTKCSCLPYDDIPAHSSIRTIYNSDYMTSFIAGIVSGIVNKSADPLYRFDDPLGALTINIIENDESIEWHFDQAQFVVIILIQNGEIGGLYEVAPEKRYLSDGSTAFEVHTNVINEVQPDIVRHRLTPGTLIIHRGTHSLHRVTRVQGNTPRISALFAYADQPGQSLSPDVRLTYYGRTDVRT